MTPIQLWNAFIGLSYKEIQRILRIWQQTLIPVVITASLYFVIFGQVIGHKIGPVDGIPYIVYLAPGLIALSITICSYMNVVSSFFSARYSRTIEELLVSPTPNWLIITGYLSGGIFRGMLNGILISIVAYVFGGFEAQQIILSIIVLLLCSCLFALTGFLNGIFAKKFDDTSVVTSFILTPLIYLGGVFYNIDQLPKVWHIISLFNPLHYIIELFRTAMLTNHTGVNFWSAFTLIVTLTILLFGACLFCLNKGIGIKN